ncbi:DEAD/DEAH box helicase [Belnapia moabensis]|uniref:DEAD/DEAH box helicase n=1 Tax=Belnapia moabensis TaxID=365533 RepID=UPI000A6B9691|nr:DEAD/DEAH box helicase [Belnapia moabensis]
MPAAAMAAEPAPAPAPEDAPESLMAESAPAVIEPAAEAPAAIPDPAELPPPAIDAAAEPEAEQDDEEEESEDEEEDGEDETPRTTFADLGLSEPILQAVAEAGYVSPTPIQEAAIPIVLMGRDVLGCAQTGTGKTAGFTLPMLDILASGRAKARMPRSLILEPTRELALQVAENFVKYGKHLNLVHALLIGGESMNDQRAVLEKGVDVLIATPGRLLDLFERGRILLADCKVLVIDEADRMLDMGFIPDVERIVSMLPPMRQTLFFSATMAPEIRKLADAFLQNPKEISVSAPASVATTITAGLLWTRELDKREALRRLIRREEVQNALIFCNRKIEVDVLYKSLKRHGFSVGALHGDMDQPSRFATLNKFKAGELQLLVCSDVAARGIDIGGLSHVFNFDVPFHAEDYVHRIGRTGRAGKQGAAFTIATPDDARNVAAIESLTGKPIPRIEVEGLDPISNEEIAEAASRPKRGRGGSAGRGGGRERDRGSRDRRPAPQADRPERGGRDRDRPERSRGERDRPERNRDRDRAPVAAREERPARDERPVREERAPREERRWDREAPRRRDRDRDDLGPSVVGFGDAVPAFMLIPIPRPRRDQQPEHEAEAA